MSLQYYINKDKTYSFFLSQPIDYKLFDHQLSIKFIVLQLAINEWIEHESKKYL